MPSYWRQVRGKKDGVPVSWFRCNSSRSNFANWPNSAGMGPGVYKTQSKHTKNKSRYPTGTKGHKESKPIPSYWMQVREKKNGVPVSSLSDKSSCFKFDNWPNSAGMGPGVYKNQSKHTKNKSCYRTGTIWLRKQAYALILKASQFGRGKRVPVSWLSCKYSWIKFANWPNLAGMGPGVYKTQSKHTKTKSRYRTGTIWLRNASLCLNIKGKSGGRGMEYR
jgi:hypothetical protein